MKVAKRKIPDFALESLEDIIKKKVAGIMLPPQTILQPQRNVLITNEITITLYDAIWGYLNLKSRVLETIGIEQMDLDSHQGLLVRVEKNDNPFKSSHERMPIPSYGISLEYSEFIIKKIEVYGQNFRLDKEGKNIGKLADKKEYRKGDIVVENDSVLVLYSESGDLIVISAEMGSLLIGFGEDYKRKLISKPSLAHVNYVNPVMLELNYQIE